MGCRGCAEVRLAVPYPDTETVGGTVPMLMPLTVTVAVPPSVAVIVSVTLACGRPSSQARDGARNDWRSPRTDLNSYTQSASGSRSDAIVPAIWHEIAAAYGGVRSVRERGTRRRLW